MAKLPKIDMKNLKESATKFVTPQAANKAKQTLKKAIPAAASVVAATAGAVEKAASAIAKSEDGEAPNLGEVIDRAKTAVKDSELKKTAQSAVVRSLRSVENLCAAGAERLGDVDGAQSSGQKNSVQDNPKTETTKTNEKVKEREKSMYDSPNNNKTVIKRRSASNGGGGRIVKPDSAYHRERRRSPLATLLVALIALGAVAFASYMWFSKRISDAEPTRDEASIVALEEGSVAVPLGDDEPQSESEFTATMSAARGARIMNLTRDGVNLRSDHSTNGTQILATLDCQEVTVLDTWQGNDAFPWYRVATNSGEGWVFGRYLAEQSQPELQITAGPVAAPVAPPAAAVSTRRRARIRGTRVNVRSDHSTNGTRVLTRLSNEPITVIETWNGSDRYPWHRIVLNNGSGWVYGQYVVFDEN